ncbi:SRPBCC family protein [Haloarcula sp. JP-Z28]|uniref:SRPBCC family protein n=1 Tax=Haloarcula sp. JP-Z28 TaxID=2716715 RepID=UPI001404AF34|nr:SRPBCC family protein [Haloarcula sp. JP-Z28]NHN64775.1 SRPBCC family protein [Haloarcula sp. JP-Z28]
MREVERSWFVMARPPAVHRTLSPEAVVAAEGTFTVTAVEETETGTLVTAAGPGMSVPLRFESHDDGLRYTAEGEVGPFDHLETRITVVPEENGSRVTMRSTVSLNLPLPFADRIAAWKRGNEIERAIEELAADVPGG